jgi:hypothetical protein
MIHLAVYFNTQSVWDLLELLDMCIITTLHDKCHAMCEATLTAIDEVHTRCFIVFTLYGLRIKDPRRSALRTIPLALVGLTVGPGPGVPEDLAEAPDSGVAR